MARFAARRLLSSLPVLFGILVFTFLLARVIPGDPCRSALGERGAAQGRDGRNRPAAPPPRRPRDPCRAAPGGRATAQICDAYNARLGLDEPVITQFRIYFTDILQGDLGESVSQRRPATEDRKS